MTDLEKLDWLQSQVDAAGIPNDGVSLGPPPRVDYQKGATAAQRQAGDALVGQLAGLNDVKLRIARKAAAKRAAKDALISQDSGPEVLTRGVLRVLATMLADNRAKVNELVAWQNAHSGNGNNIDPLPALTWQQVTAALVAAIDAETDPTA